MKIPQRITLLCWIYLFTLSVQAQDMKQLSYEHLDSLMLLSYNKGNYQEAIQYMQVGLEKSKLEYGPIDPVYATYVTNLGFFHDKLGNYERAESLYLEGIDIYLALYGFKGESYVIALNNLALLYYTMGKYEQAAPIFDRILFIHRNELNKNSPNYPVAVGNFAGLCMELADYKKAEKLYLEAIDLKLKKYGENSIEYAYSIGNLAALYVQLDKNEEGILLYKQAMLIFKNMLGESHPVYGQVLNNLAVIYTDINQYEKAERLLLESQEIKKNKLGENHVDYARGLGNLAGLYKDQKKYEKAELLYRESIKIYESIYPENHISITTPFENIASIYTQKGAFYEAIELLTKVKEIRGSYYESTHPLYIRVLNDLGSTYLNKGSLDTALAYSILALAMNSDNFETLYPQCVLTNPKSIDPMEFINQYQSTKEHGNYSKLTQLNYLSVFTLKYTLQILLEITKEIHEQAIDGQAVEVKRLKEHYILAKVTMDFSRQIRNDFSEKENKLHILRQYHPFAEYGILAALKLDKEEYYKEVFQFAEQNKSILLANAMNGNRARTLGDLPDSLILLELNLQEEKEFLEKERLKLSNTPNVSGTKKELLARENILNQEVEAFLKSIKDKYPKYHALKYVDNTISVDNIQAKLDDQSLLLEYLIFSDKIYVFVISATTVELIPIQLSEKELKKQVKVLRDALSNYKLLLKEPEVAFNNYTTSAHWFYKNLLEVALNEKEVKRLIIVSDGALGHLPFESFLMKLPKEGVKGYENLDYLMQKYKISYHYSASLWGAYQNFKASTSVLKKGQLLAFAASYPTKVDSSWLKYRSSSNFELRTLLSPLPNVQKEVEVLEETFNGKYLKGAAANEALFKKYAKEYSLIHLAMHGVLDAKVPMLSSLAFSENLDSLEDNFLQAYEISKLNLKADLVVLSACETGYGKFKQGEGVMSLGRSFMYAGTPSLVVSLWSVNDYSTALIMQNLYANLAKGLSKDEALRLAKITYIKTTKGITAHPAFWSPFIQLGNYKPIYVAKKTTWSWWWILFGMISLIGAVFTIKKMKEV